MGEQKAKESKNMRCPERFGLANENCIGKECAHWISVVGKKKRWGACAKAVQAVKSTGVKLRVLKLYVNANDVEEIS